VKRLWHAIKRLFARALRPPVVSPRNLLVNAYIGDSDLKRRENAAGVWIVMSLVAGLCLAQLLASVRRNDTHERDVPTCEPVVCDCRPPDGYSAAIFCSGQVTARIRPPAASEWDRKLSKVD